MEKYKTKSVLTVLDVQNILQLGRNSTYEFINKSDCPFPVIRIGRQFRIPTVQFYTWLDIFMLEQLQITTEKAFPQTNTYFLRFCNH